MDLAAQIASLKNDLGASKGPNAAASFAVELWLGHPDNGGSEVPDTTDVEDDDTGAVTTVDNGYAAVTGFTNDGTNFPAPDAVTGQVTTPVVTWPASTAEYPGTVTHWVLRDTATGAVWYVGAIPQDQWIDVDDAGVAPALELIVFVNDLATAVG